MMSVKQTAQQLRGDALAIWQAGLEAVRSDRLVRDRVRVDGQWLVIAEEKFDLSSIRCIAVVGAGKAGAGMAAGLEAALGAELMAQKQLTGWINVPQDCVTELDRIKLHAARPARINEPTSEGVIGAEQILKLVESLTEDDLCLCLISGGGSALLPAPIDGISLADKQAVTQHLSAAGANIQQLNTVRKQLSRIKGGGLARACRARRLISLIISDVIGDPLDIIASGPTVDDSSTPELALEVLEQFGARQAEISPAVFQYLKQAAQQKRLAAAPRTCSVSNVVIGNNESAVKAAGAEAERRGYVTSTFAAQQLEGPAEKIGRQLAEAALRLRSERGAQCLVTGGEPTVKLAPAGQRGLGGRNQQLVLAALEHLLHAASGSADELPGRGSLDDIVLLSGGTDGEDGPTDAAGAIIDADVFQKMRQQGCDPAVYLRRNDAYHFFQVLDALIKTGPTHTNVCDVRVVVTAQCDADCNV
jgi:hydroxypyruvate reductase